METRRDSSGGEPNSQTVTLIGLPVKTESGGRIAEVRKNRALPIAETSPGAANGIFHDLDYLRFFQRLPKLKLHAA